LPYRFVTRDASPGVAGSARLRRTSPPVYHQPVLERIPLPVSIARTAKCGVRQPCCRASRAHEQTQVAADSRTGS
ncbi:MAG: hypothetical protein ACUVS0_03750, partial [Chloroflexus sp.]